MNIRAFARTAAAVATVALLGAAVPTSAQAADPVITSDRIQGKFVTMPDSWPMADNKIHLEGWQVTSSLGYTINWGTQSRVSRQPSTFMLSNPMWKENVPADTISAPAPGTSGVVRFEDGIGKGKCMDLSMRTVVDCASAPKFTWVAAAGGDSAKSQLHVLVNAENKPFRDNFWYASPDWNYPASNTAAGFNISGWTPVAPQTPPTASMSVIVDGLDAGFDGSASTAADGRTIASYAWDFGDGQTGTGRTAKHTYAQPGTYTATLTVTDSAGITGTTSTTLTVSAKPTVTTTAVIDMEINELKATFDGSRSSSSDGTPITSYAWEFGDGATASGPQTSHVYPASGTYIVTLTVTDAAGRTATTTRTFGAIAKSAIVYDTWGRTSTSKWGTANIGGTWTNMPGMAIEGAGVGTMTFDETGKTIQSYLNKVSARDVDVSFQMSFDALPGGNGTMLGSIVRKSDAGNYRVKLVATDDGTMTVNLVRYIGTTESYLASYTMAKPYTPGQVLNVRFQAVGAGTTTLAAKAWPAGTTEPFTWQVTTTDDTPALQKAGYVGFAGYISSLAPSTDGQKIRIDNYRIVKP